MYWHMRYSDCELQWSTCLTCPNAGMFDCKGHFASNLGYYIQYRGLTVPYVAKRIGMRLNRLREYVYGDLDINRIPAEVLFDIADVLDVPARWLLEPKLKK